MAGKRKFQNYQCSTLRLPKQLESQFNHLARCLDQGYQVNATILRPNDGQPEVISVVIYTSKSVIETSPDMMLDSFHSQALRLQSNSISLKTEMAALGNSAQNEQS